MRSASESGLGGVSWVLGWGAPRFLVVGMSWELRVVDKRLKTVPYIFAAPARGMCCSKNSPM